MWPDAPRRFYFAMLSFVNVSPCTLAKRRCCNGFEAEFAHAIALDMPLVSEL